MIRHSSLSHAHNDSEEGHHPHFLGTNEKKHAHTQDIASQKASFCIPRCFACKNEMQFSAGEIIYGEKWYHRSCWKDIEAVIELVSQ
ncbi:hypothetical protein [Candidatus Nitrosotalea sp. FS]|uniref:hypothetical protein n=1 Tax=Candidatus Nitrosotalea sp. FS TaxID=2341021 RepID=UPI00140E8890|nr:hypothetical protein [Candidatus Nitrosotalea sp. FS]